MMASKELSSLPKLECLRAYCQGWVASYGYGGRVAHGVWSSDAQLAWYRGYDAGQASFALAMDMERQRAGLPSGVSVHHRIGVLISLPEARRALEQELKTLALEREASK